MSNFHEIFVYHHKNEFHGSKCLTSTTLRSLQENEQLESM